MLLVFKSQVGRFFPAPRVYFIYSNTSMASFFTFKSLTYLELFLAYSIKKGSILFHNKIIFLNKYKI